MVSDGDAVLAAGLIVQMVLWMQSTAGRQRAWSMSWRARCNVRDRSASRRWRRWPSRAGRDGHLPVWHRLDGKGADLMLVPVCLSWPR